MKVLITGGAGFIGHNLAHHLLERGHEIRVLDDLSTGYRENLEDLDVDFREASLLDEEAVAAAVNGVESVVHLGALGSVPRSIKDPVASHHANATGTVNLLNEVRKAGSAHVISASSSSVYGMNPALPKNEREWTRPMSPYAVSKLATEQYTLAFQESFGIPTTAFRFFNVYGPGQRAGHAYAAVIPTWVDAILKGDPITINGDGSNSRDFTYVGTVCDVLTCAIEEVVSHAEPVNLAFGTSTSLLGLVEQLTSLAGHSIETVHRDPRPGDVPHSQADCSVLNVLFPNVSPRPLGEGLEATYRWMREDYRSAGHH